jgi:hypothetical protein
MIDAYTMRRYNIVASANYLGRSGNLNNHWLFADLHALAFNRTRPQSRPRRTVVIVDADFCRARPRAFGHGSSPTVALAVEIL